MKIARIEYPSIVEWRNELGQLHREEGPAIVCADGSKEWWINGKRVSEQEFNDYILRKRLQRIMEL